VNIVHSRGGARSSYTMTSRISRLYCNRRHHRSHPSSAPLPASGSVCDSPLSLAPPPALPFNILDSVPTSFPAVVQAPGLTAEVPGLAAGSLEFSRLLKKFCSTSCCLGLITLPRIADVGAPERLPRPRVQPALLPSISASARLTVGREKDDESKCPMRPAAGGADAS
jgi:hypothetical protein